jgi:hypothetical protein
MNNRKDLECPKTRKEFFKAFSASVNFETEFMTVICDGLADKELYVDRLNKVCQQYKGYFFYSPGGNYIVSLGSTWEGLRI